MRIQALGGYRIVVDGRDLRLRTRKEALLLLRLALAGVEGVSRDECVGLLWPDSSEARARHSLSEALRGIEMATQLEVVRTPERLALPATAVGFDVRELDDAIAAGDVDACARLHKGGFLAGWYPPTAEASHWVDAVAASVALRLEKALRKELAQRRQATDGRGVVIAAALLELLGVATDDDREAATESEQLIAWESLRPGESVRSRMADDREGPFVGRVEEMKILTRELERAMSGEVRVVLVSGEPGIGKTRTCQRLARLAALRGASLFLSTCYELEQSVAYGAISEAFAGISASDVRHVRTVYRDALTGLLPGLDMPSEEATSGLPLSAHVTLQAFAKLFETACKRKPGVLLIDDVQWSDAASCQVVHFLLRSLDRTVSGLIVLAYRQDELETNAPARTLVRNADSLASVRLDLAPLSVSEIGVQVAALCPQIGDRRITIAETALGNPFFARELALAEAHHERGGSTVTDVILARTQSLSETEADVLRALSVAAVPLTIEELASITSATPAAEISAVVELERKRLLVDVEGGVAVGHDLIRSAIYGALSTSHQRSLHASVAGALSHRDNPALLAHHYTVSGQKREGREMALRAATRSRLARDYSEEVRFLKMALENTTDDIQATLQLVSSRMFSLARFREAAALLSQYAKDLDQTLRLRKSVAELKQLTVNDLPGGYAFCDRLFDQCATFGAGIEAVEALREKMRLAQENSDNGLVLQTATRLESFGLSWPEPAVAAQARAFALLKLTSFSPTLVSDRLTKLQRFIRDEVRSNADEVLFTVSQTSGLHSYNIGEITKAGLELNATISRSRANGDVLQELRARTLLVPISTEAGRFGRASRHARFVIEYARYGDAYWENVVALVNYASLLWEIGDTTGARKIALEGIEKERERPMWAANSHFQAILGLCDLEAGEMSDVKTTLARLSELLPPIQKWVSDMSIPVLFLSRAMRILGRDRASIALLEDAVAHAENHHRVFYWTMRLELAAVRLRRGSSAEVSKVREIREEAEKKGCRLVAWKAIHTLQVREGPGEQLRPPLVRRFHPLPYGS